jgi:methionyl-tRNA synthetase
MLFDGLPDIALTHHTNWGIPVPVARFTDQRLYVWFEMAVGFLAATTELDGREQNGGRWADAWKSADARIVQFFGFDNGFFFAVLFPAILLALNPEIQLPSAFVTNEFYRLEGAKFSTSRNHAIWGRDLIAESSSDAVRFYLSHTSPEREQSNFRRDDFFDVVRRELAGEWQGWLQELGAKVERDYGGVVPAATQLAVDHRLFLAALRELVNQAEGAYSAEAFSPQKASRTCCELVRIARRFGKSEDHWRSVPGREVRKAAGVAMELLAAKLLAVLSAPIVPSFAARLWEALGYISSTAEKSWMNALEPVAVGGKLQGLDALRFEIFDQQPNEQCSVDVR